MKKILISLTAAALMLLMCVYLASPALAAGTAPIAENLEIKTYRNVSVGGKMSAYDPDGDVVSYEITTQPVKGKIVQGEDGSFTYTPNDNKRGKDYFGYKAVDAEGNVSQEATVIIRIEKQKKDVCYEDMNGRAEEYAAVALSENNIFTAEIVCSKYIIDDINIAELFVPHIIVCKSNAAGTFTAKNPARGINIQFQISYDNAG